MRTIYKIASYGLLIGVVHTALTPVFYPDFTEDALWFAGTGLALIFLSFLNIAAERVPERLTLNLCIIANIVFLTFSLMLLTLLPVFQAWISFILVLLVTIGTISLRKSAYSHRRHKTSLAKSQ